VLTVQGIASMTALKVDGSAVTQPVSDGGSTLSVDDGGGSLTVDNAALSVTGGGAEASALRVTLASDSTGVLSVDDNGSTLSVDDGGGALTVDGTVAATQSGTWNITNVSGTVSLPTGAATAAKQPALGTAGTASSDVITIQGVASMTPLQVADNGSTLSVDDGAGSLTVDNAALSVTGGGAEATALRVTLASDSTGVLSVDDNGSTLSVDDGGGTLTVDGTVAISGEVDVTPASPAAGSYLPVRLSDGSGFLGAAAAGLYVRQGSGAQFIVTGTTGHGAADDSASPQKVGGVASAAAPTAVDEGDRVQAWFDLEGRQAVHDGGQTLSVDDGAGSLTVDNAALSVTGGGAEATALRVTLASDSTGVLSVDDNGSTLSVDDGGASLTVDGTVTANLAAGTNNIGDVDVLTQPARARTTDTISAALATDVLMNDTTALTPKFAVIDVASSGDNTLVAAVVGKKIRVHQVLLVAAGAVNARFESGAGGTALTGQMNLTTNSGFTLPFSPVGWFETASNTLLNLELSGAVSTDGVLCYTEV
jgi:hypothetical protein